MDPRELVEEFLGYPVTKKMGVEAGLRLEERWYASGETDFGIYDSVDFLLHILRWQHTAQDSVAHAIDWLRRNRIRVERVLDHGAGLGFTTVALAQAFPDARVVGTNLPGLQRSFNDFLLARAGVQNLEFIPPDEALARRFDVVLCFEVFEHFKEPAVELDRVLSSKPAVLIDRSSFSLRCPGHFDIYTIDGKPSRGRGFQEATFAFSRCIRRAGYRYHWTEFYNGRPRIWLRSDVVSLEATSRAWRRRLGKYQGDSGPLIVPV